MTEDKKRKPVKYPLLCFDSETTNHGELLELSVFDMYGNEVYHKYFKPRAKKWPSDIHHITPDMVADCKRFAAHRNEVRNLLNSTRNLVGCALSNDLNTLRRHGVQLSDAQHTVFEIQNWFWLLNDSSGRQDKHQAGLSTIADHYGLSFGDEHAHSATADTRVTLECFKALVADFDSKYGDENTPSVEPILSADADAELAAESLTELNRRYGKAFQYAMQVYRMNNSAGFINVVRREQGYSLKYSRFKPTGNDNIVFSVPVADRVKAEIDLRNHFEPIQLKGFTGIYAMSESDFDYVRNYTNSIDLATFLARQKRENTASPTPQERARKTLASKKETEVSQDNSQKGSSASRRKSKSSKKAWYKSRQGKVTGKAKSKTRAATHAMRTAKKASKDN